MSRFPAIALVVGLAACASDSGELALLGPYREPVDECRWVSPTPDTVPFLQEGTDLVACPKGYAGIPIFIADVNATEVGRIGTWILYRVPQP